MPQSIFLTRHGQRIDRINKDWKSAPGNPGSLHLSPHGIAQATALGERLRGEGVVRIFASPFYRTVETAHYVAEALDVPICIERGVCEFLQPRYFPGPMAVRSPAEMAAVFPRVDLSYATMMDPQPPEDDDRLLARTREAMRRLLEVESGTFLIVSHGKVARHLCAPLLGGLRDEMRTSLECAVTQLRRADTGSGWELVHDGDDAHLPPDPNAVAV